MVARGTATVRNGSPLPSAHLSVGVDSLEYDLTEGAGGQALELDDQGRRGPTEMTDKTKSPRNDGGSGDRRGLTLRWHLAVRLDNQADEGSGRAAIRELVERRLFSEIPRPGAGSESSKDDVQLSWSQRRQAGGALRGELQVWLTRLPPDDDTEPVVTKNSDGLEAVDREE